MKKSSDLNEIFPDIGRKSERHDEAGYYDRLRISPAPTVISGGQSGADSAGLEAASFLGLPAFAVLPKGKRRENGDFDEYVRRSGISVRALELGSESYRFRTYASAYFADATVIYDYVGSEGTRAAVSACAYFGRPCLVLSGTDGEHSERLNAFLSACRPDVLNVAGNTLGKISSGTEEEIRRHLTGALKRYCFFRKNPGFSPETAGSDNSRPTVAIPNFGVCKAIFADFLRKSYGYEMRWTGRLVYDVGPFSVVAARPREIVGLVNRGLDAGFVGGDLLREYRPAAPVLLDTGLIPNATVLAAAPGKDLSGCKNICSQYPAIAREELPDAEVTPISGSAECYLALGMFDGCVDSYQTGRTLAENGMRDARKLLETSLTLIGAPEFLRSDFFAKWVGYCIGDR